MDCTKVGALIKNLRKEKQMTQKDIAGWMNISDKTISKWERGLGCPDVTLLSELSGILGVSIEKILTGELNKKNRDGSNMKLIKFYVCSNCSNVINSLSHAEICCCGRKIEALTVQSENIEHQINLIDIEDEYYLTMDHPMTKTHFISFVACVGFDRVILIKLYPEQNAELRIPKLHRGKLYAYCSIHGLWKV